jgi:hypothetical protein
MQEHPAVTQFRITHLTPSFYSLNFHHQIKTPFNFMRRVHFSVQCSAVTLGKLIIQNKQHCKGWCQFPHKLCELYYNFLQHTPKAKANPYNCTRICTLTSCSHIKFFVPISHQQRSRKNMWKSGTWLAAFRNKTETHQGSGQYPNTLHRWNSNQYTTWQPTVVKAAFSNHKYTNHYTTRYNSTSCTLEHTQYSTRDTYWLL